jgi:hypothetical protein
MTRQNKKIAVNLDREDGGFDPSCQSRSHISVLKDPVKRLPRPIDDRVDVTEGAAKWSRIAGHRSSQCHGRRSSVEPRRLP